MNIISISRKITGGNYDNISMTANLDEGEDPIKAVVQLDIKCHEALNGIVEHKATEEIRNHEERKMLDKVEALKTAIKKHEIDDLPF